MSDRQRVPRERLDRILVERGLAPTRSRANALILAGRVRSGTSRLIKPGERHPRDIELDIEPGRRYVSRGGYKLEAALAGFELVVVGRDCIDVGASTGGFTQVLLEAGARRVIALDVGRGQLDWGLRADDRVVPMEGINARDLPQIDLPFRPSLAVVDVAFISLDLVLPAVVAILDPHEPRDVIALVKPQFEVGRRRVGRGGIVRDPDAHHEVLAHAIDFAAGRAWAVAGLTPSPITGADGNREFLLHIRPGRPGLSSADLDRAVRAAIVFPGEGEAAR